jgi:predicted nuclease with TOPRIM domain
MAEHFEEIVQLRVSALETRVDVETKAVQEHFQELMSVINDGVVESRAGFLECRQEFRGLKARMTALEGRMDRLEERMDRLEERMDRLEVRMDRLEVRMDRLEVRFDRWERKLDAHTEATAVAFREILRRLPPAA